MKQKMADSWLIFLFGLNLRCKMFFKIISKHAYSIYCNMGLKIRSWNRIQNKFFRIHNTGISLYFWQNYRTSFFIIQYITITVQNLLQNFSNIGQYTKYWIYGIRPNRISGIISILCIWYEKHIDFFNFVPFFKEILVLEASKVEPIGK